MTSIARELGAAPPGVADVVASAVAARFGLAPAGTSLIRHRPLMRRRAT